MLTKKKIYILDGATGTVIQDYHLSEKDYTDNNYKYIGCHEILNKTRQDIILDIHKKYIEAGADIIETNTFNSNSISLKDYGLENESYFLSFLGAKLAREAVENSKKEILVAGSIGPTNKSASISTSKSILDREIDFNELFESYLIQARGLVDGGVDLFLIETIFDGLNAKAAVIACEKVAKENSKKIPIMISATVNKNGKILSGQDIKSLITSLDRDSIISFGLNCSFGAKDLIPLIESLNPYTDKLLSVYPNAGLPNENGEYDEKPQITLEYLKKLIDNKKINIIGGCCGTTPAHIKLISDYSKNYLPREINFKEINKFFLAGNLPLEDNKNFYLIGERNNVAGSRKFKRLIEEKKYEEAIEIAKEQIENGADIIDINLDDALLDSKRSLKYF
ncbi:homocysteine S-methyltransferase family protein (plasmid) [Cetobacterium somerae]|uniref:homocysteine S-methyltransferase family protein n=1 Tax=Cetobacterium somerae TaxID=188913 RepID=UPI0038916D68